MESVEIYSDQELDQYYTGDGLQAYVNEIKKYPTLSKEECEQLFYEYKDGSQEAKDWLIKCNLRLVLSVAYKYRTNITHMQLLDVIQEGNLGLFRALETYDPSRGMFSTYAWNWIAQRIRRGIGNKEKDIRIPIGMQVYINRYRKIMRNYENKKGPSDEELCDILDVPLTTLKAIKKASEMMIVSMNAPIDEEEESELGDFFPSEETGYDQVLESMHNREIFLVLKEILSSLNYYVVYNRILHENMSLEDIGRKLGVTREWIRQVESKALRKIRPLMEGDRKRFYGVLEGIKKREGRRIEDLREEPIEPEKIVIYYFVKDYLSEEERKYLYEREFSKYVGEIDEFYERVLDEKIRILLSDQERFDSFRDAFIKSYKTKMFTLEMDASVDLIDYRRIKQSYDGISFEKLKEVVERFGIELGVNEWDLLKRYFGTYEVTGMDTKKIEREMNLVKYGYINRSCGVAKEQLYETYLKYRDEFNSEQQDFLEGYYFKVRAPKVMLDGDARKRHYFAHVYLEERLERMHYGLSKYFVSNFGKKEYLVIRESNAKALGSERIKVLDLAFGVGCKEHNTLEMAEILGVDQAKAQIMLRNAKEAAYGLYVGLSNRVVVDKSKYMPYLEDNICGFNDRQLEILRLFLVDELSHEEIGKRVGMKNVQVSKQVRYIIERIDYFRFGIIVPFIVDKKTLDEFFDTKDGKYSEVEKIIIEKKYALGWDNVRIVKELGIDEKVVVAANRKFTAMYEKYLIKGVLVSDEEVVEEVLLHKSESVLSEREREFASFYLGIKNEYNVLGEKLNRVELMERFNYSKRDYSRILEQLVREIRLKKRGIKRAEYVFYKRSELIEILKDKRLPISEKDRDVICYMFGLEGYPCRSLAQIAEDNNVTVVTIRDRYYKAIINIGKYLNKEISGSISYEDDIKPILKYFSKIDREYIELYYRDNLGYDEIAKRMGVSFNRVTTNIYKIRANVFEMLNNEDARKFDYDYYESVKNNNDLPFFGNKDVAIKMFEMYTGMNGEEKLSLPEIGKELGLEIGQTLGLKLVYGLMIAVCKYQSGMRVGRVFTYEEVLSYYEENKDKMDWVQRGFYKRYFAVRDESGRYYSKNMMSEKIILDLIKAHNDGYLSLEEMNADSVLEFLEDYGIYLKKDVRHELMALYGITSRVFMNGKDVNHVLKIVHNIEEKVMRMEGKLLLQLV